MRNIKHIISKGLNKEEHIKRHQELHKYLDELVADFLTHNSDIMGRKFLTGTSIMELIHWSYLQTKNPTKICQRKKHWLEKN